MIDQSGDAACVPVAGHDNRLRWRLYLLLSGCAITALVMPSASVAQEVLASSADPSSEKAEIVVTAQKRSQNIQDVPVAVGVIGSQLIADSHATQLSDLQGYIPGLAINSVGSPGQTQVTIRGIAVLGQNSVVGTYIGESPVGGSSLYTRSQSFSLDLLPYDVERIEVLRGPQGTLYGASTLGGLLKYVLKDPNLKNFEGQAGVDVFGVNGASAAGYGGRVLVSAPIITNKLGVLASFAYEGTPGYIDDITTGKKNDNSLSQLSARLAVLWQPTDKLSVRGEALYQHIISDNAAEIPVDSTANPKPLLGDLHANNAVDQPFSKEIQFYGLTAKYDFGWANLISASSYSYSDTRKQTDVSSLFGTLYPLFGQPAGLAPLGYVLKTAKFTEEVRLASPAGSRLEWQIGTFDTYERSTNDQVVTPLTNAGTPIPSITPFYIGGFTPSHYREFAGFGDVTFHLTSLLYIGGGVRYAKNVQDYTSISAGLLNGLPITAAPTTVYLRSREGVVTYSVSPSYHFTKDILVYARVASGYSPGGPNVILAGIPPSVGSETITNYEGGLKAQFLQNRLIFDVDYFYIDWSKIQVGGTANGIGYLFNGGTARSQGVEANATIRPLRGLSLSGSFAYIDAQLTQDVPSIGGLSGQELPEVPRYSGAVRADYSRSLGTDWTGHIGGGVRITGSEADGLFGSLVRLPGYAIVDFDLSATYKNYSVRLFAKNLNDSRALTSYMPFGAPQAYIVQPRTIGLAVDTKF